MALLRRRKQEEAQDPQAPAAAEPARGEPSEADAQATGWLPPTVAGDRPSQPDNTTPRDWVPGGMEGRPHRRRSAANAPLATPADAAPADVAPAPPPAAAPAMSSASAPPASTEDLRARLAQLEQQIAAAQRADAANRAAGHAPTEAEAAANADLQRAVIDLRARLDQQSGTQSETIASLEARLAKAEERLHPPGYRPPAARAATLMRILVSIAVFIVIAGAPLFMTRRTTCRTTVKHTVHWALVKPFDDSGPARCTNELGGTVLLHSIGLK